MTAEDPIEDSTSDAMQVVQDTLEPVFTPPTKPALRKGNNYVPQLTPAQVKALSTFVAMPEATLPPVNSIPLSVQEFDAFCNIPEVS
jgi:hypothetical protein